MIKKIKRWLWVRKDPKNRSHRWHRWENVPKHKIIYYDEDEWWNKFIPWVMKENYEKMANKTIKQKITRWFFKIKVTKMLRGWCGWNNEGTQTIYLRDKTYHPKTLHHEIGHLICIDHSWKPGLMNPIWIFRWF